ncbi:MAG: hypothetical protein WAO08_07860 [Hyphomicrobiaceae bacterium]
MKARQLVESGSFGPDALKVAYQAFDEAWESVAAHFGTDPVAIEAARLRLANAILAVTHNDSRDVSALKTAALAILAAHYRLDLKT